MWNLRRLGGALALALVWGCTDDPTASPWRDLDGVSSGLASDVAVKDGVVSDVGPAPWGDAVTLPSPAAAPQNLPNVICELWGNADEVVACPLLVARQTKAMPAPTAIGGDVFFPKQAQPIQLWELTCAPGPAGSAAPICTPKRIETNADPVNTPAAWLKSGHPVRTKPVALDTWGQGGGGGRLELLPAKTNAPLSAAYLTASSELSGVTYPEDAVPVWIHFKLREAIPKAKPLPVYFRGIKASAGSAGPTLAVANQTNTSTYGLGVVVSTPCSTAADCDDLDPDTNDFCSPATATCAYTPKAACDDGDPCTEGDTFDSAGLCAGKPKACSDGDPCTDDACVNGKCRYDTTTRTLPNQPTATYTLCRTPSTWQAAAAACQTKKAQLVAFASDDETESLAAEMNSFLFQTSEAFWTALTDAATEGRFAWTPGGGGYLPWTAAAPPPNGADEDCVVVYEEPTRTPRFDVEVTSCAGTRPFICKTDTPCPDKPCNISTFDAIAKTCVYTPKAGACDDGQPCTDDVCNAGVCVSTPKNCDDNSPCTLDQCLAGKCTNAAPQGLSFTAERYAFCPGSRSWADAKAECGKLGMTLATISTGATNKDVFGRAQAANKTQDWWIGLTDAAAEQSYVWDDGFAFTPVSYRNWGSGQGQDAAEDCVSLAVTGSPTNQQTWADNACSEARPFVCSKRCDDNNPCTDDAIDSNNQCIYTPRSGTPCDDGLICTEGDVCEAGACKAGKPRVCEDNDPCTWDKCDPAKGCENKRVTYWNSQAKDTRGLQFCAASKTWIQAKSTCESQGGSLGLEAPSALSGALGGLQLWTGVTDQTTEGTYVWSTPSGERALPAPPSWAPGQPGAEDCATIDPTTGQLSMRSCDQYQAPGFVCRYECKSTNPCQQAEFDPVKGCRLVNINEGQACDDGDACTTDGKCSAGQCTKGPPKICDDKNPCTVDSCRADTGCASRLDYVYTSFNKKNASVAYLRCGSANFDDGASRCQAQGPGWRMFGPTAAEELDEMNAAGLLTGAPYLFARWPFPGYDSNIDAPDGAGGYLASKICQANEPFWNNAATAVSSGTGYCVDRVDPKEVHPVLCRADTASPQSYILRAPAGPPKGVTADPKYSTSPTLLKLMPKRASTLNEARDMCQQAGGTLAPWWLLREAGVKAMATTRAVPQLIATSWHRTRATYTQTDFSKSVSSSTAQAQNDAGWGAPTDFFCGFKPKVVGFGLWDQLWPKQPQACGSFGGGACGHDYDGWYTKMPQDWTLNGQGKITWPDSAPIGTSSMSLASVNEGCLYYRKGVGTYFPNNVNGIECWQDAYSVMDTSGSKSCLKVRNTAAPRGVVCELPVPTWDEGGPKVAKADFLCGRCKYWDGATNQCKPNVVTIGTKHYVSCVAPEATGKQTDFATVVAGYNNNNDWSGVCGKVSGGAYAHLSLAVPTSSELTTIQTALNERRYTPGGQNVALFGAADKYYDWVFYNGGAAGQSGCFLMNVQTGEKKDCTTVNNQFPADKVGTYRVLCEQTCLDTGTVGACYTSALTEDFKCVVGGASRKAAGTVCDDGSGCSSGGVCNDLGQCVSSGKTACSGDACAPQTCLKGVGCVPLGEVDCDDNNPCTQDSCQVANGKASCVNAVTVCADDGKPCTQDFCTPGFGCYRPKECDDLDPCTIDSCDPATGCKHLADPVAAGQPGCGVTPVGACVTVSQNGARLTIGCQPGGGSYELTLPPGGVWRPSPMDEVGSATQYKNWSYEDDVPKNLTLTSPQLKLPPGATGVFIAGTKLSVSNTNPPRVFGTATGLPQFSFGPLKGFQVTTTSTVAPFRVTSGPSGYLRKKHVELPQTAWCSFVDQALVTGCQATPQVVPQPTLPVSSTDPALPNSGAANTSQWLAFEWDASAAGLDLETAGLAGAQAPTAVKKTGPRSLVFSPLEPGLGFRTTDTTLRGGADSNLESAQWLLSYSRALSKTTPTLTTLSWKNGVSQIGTGTFGLRGHVYTAAAAKQLSLLGLPMRFQGGLLVDLDPNDDGIVSPDSSKALFTSGTIAAINQVGDSGLDLTALGEGRLGVDLAFGTFIPNHGEAIGSISMAFDQATWTFDSRLGQPGTGLRIVGQAKVPALPKVFTWLKVTGAPLAASLFVDGVRPTPDTKPDFRLSLTGSYELSASLSGLDKAFVGTITFGTKEVRLDGEITYFGQKLSLSGQIQTSSGTFNGDYLLCTQPMTTLTLSAASGLPTGRGRVCLGATAVTVDLDAAAESAWTKRDSVKGVFFPWELDQGTFEGLAKCPGSNLFTIYPGGSAVEFCAGNAPQNQLAVTTSIFVQLIANLRISQSRPYTGSAATATVTSDGTMRWRENTWSLSAQSGVNALTVEPLAAASAPLQGGKFSLRLAAPFASEWLCATVSPFTLVGGPCP